LFLLPAPNPLGAGETKLKREAAAKPMYLNSLKGGEGRMYKRVAEIITGQVGFHESLITDYNSRFLIDTPAIRNAPNLLKINGGASF